MKMETATLTGRDLNAAVAVAEGATYNPRERVWTWLDNPARYSMKPHAYTGTSMGDDIIDREMIGTRPPWDAVAPNGTVLKPPGWYATIRTEHTTYVQHGATRREAAMRCYVVSKLGDEVDVPQDPLDTP